MGGAHPIFRNCRGNQNYLLIVQRSVQQSPPMDEFHDITGRSHREQQLVNRQRSKPIAAHTTNRLGCELTWLSWTGSRKQGFQEDTVAVPPPQMQAGFQIKNVTPKMPRMNPWESFLKSEMFGLNYAMCGITLTRQVQLGVINHWRCNQVRNCCLAKAIL